MKQNKKMLVVAVAAILLVCVITAIGVNSKKNDIQPQKTKPVDENITHVTTEATTEAPTTKRFSPDDKLIALTFDDGPYSPVTERILDVLEKNNSVATFFVVGDRVDTYQKSLKRAFDMGCQIGSHTYSHTYLKSSTSNEVIKSEIDKSLSAIKNITGEDVIIMRPPGGFCNERISLPEIMWSVDSLDWKNRNADKNYNNVMNNVYDGCIVLMHDLYPATADAVERMVPQLIADGYKLVTVSELMEARGINMEAGKSYNSAKPVVEETTSEATSTTSSVSTTYTPDTVE